MADALHGGFSDAGVTETEALAPALEPLDDDVLGLGATAVVGTPGAEGTVTDDASDGTDATDATFAPAETVPAPVFSDAQADDDSAFGAAPVAEVAAAPTDDFADASFDDAPATDDDSAFSDL